ncbi:MAG: aminopeptidase [Haloarculaceae archaeon]
MDDRIHRHAETLVDWSARVDPGEDVVVSVGRGAHDLGVAVASVLGERGANPVTTYGSEELHMAYLRAHDGDFDEAPAPALALYEGADSALFLRGTRNDSEGADVPDEVRQAYAEARKAVREARMETDWVSTVHPTRAMAQRAGMSYPEYQEFVYDAVLRDWESLAEEMARLQTVLDEGEEVRILKGKPKRGDVAGGAGDSAERRADSTTVETDLSMSIAGRRAVNSAASVAYDSHNLPSGEVYTAPVVESVEGTVAFDVPMVINDRQVRDVRLDFEDGEVADWAAGQGADAIEAVLETDAGARRIGELGIGTNRGIDRPTGQILFDEKMAGTVHLALGRAYDVCLPEGEDGNDSASHTDLITDMSRPGTRLEVDGEVIQRDGVFRWEDGFEG